MGIGTRNLQHHIEWISGAQNKVAGGLSCLVKLPEDKPVPVNMLSATNTDGLTFNTRSQTCQHPFPDNSTSQPYVTPDVLEATDPTLKSLTVDRLQALLQMQKKLILSANEYPNTYQMEKHLSTKLISSYM